MVGEKHPPMHLRDLVYKTDNKREINFDGREAIARADVVIVEVSSLKSKRIDGWDLNLHRAFGAEKRSDPRLSGMTTQGHSTEDMHAHLGALRDMTGKPLILIDHIWTTINNRALPMREILSQRLADVGARDGYGVFHTKSVLSKHRREDCLEDNDHYRDEFAPLMGGKILSYVENYLLGHMACFT